MAIGKRHRYMHTHRMHAHSPSRRSTFVIEQQNEGTKQEKKKAKEQ